jgi:MFS family permease
VISGLFTLAASVIWGVNTLFLLDAGLDIFEVVNAAYTAGMVIFEIQTGVVADTSGRRRSFLLSVAILAFGSFSMSRLPHLVGPDRVRAGVGRARAGILLLLGGGGGMARRRAGRDRL